MKIIVFSDSHRQSKIMRGVMLTHGHLFSAKTSLSALIDEGRARRADLVLFGHTHTPLEKTVEQDGHYMTLFNPGSVGMGGSYGVVELLPAGILCSVVK